MEYLREGWMTLFDYHANEYARGHLLKGLEAILNYLGTAGMVHGDFWMANIMLKPGKEEEVVLVDFD
jgi:RIO-like serine/threonine protein kinase